MSYFASSSRAVASGSINQFFRLTSVSIIPAKPLVQAKLKCGGFYVSDQHGGLGNLSRHSKAKAEAHQLFCEQLPKLLACPAIADKRRRNELNEVLAA